MPTIIIVIEIINKDVIILHFLECSCQNIKDNRRGINTEKEAKLSLAYDMIIFLENDSNIKLSSDLVRPWNRSCLPHALSASWGVLCPWPPITWWLTLRLIHSVQPQDFPYFSTGHICSPSQPHVPLSPPSMSCLCDTFWERLSLSSLTNVPLWVAFPED